MRRKAQRRGEGYGSELVNEPETPADLNLPHPVIALLPLIIVGVANLLFTWLIPQAYGSHFLIDLPGLKAPMESDVKKMVAIWAVMAALLCGIITIFLFAGRSLKGKLADGSKVAVGGAMLAALNTASEYGFGGVIAALPGFVQVADALKAIPKPFTQSGDYDQYFVRDHRFILRWNEYCPGGDGGSLCGVGPCCGDPAGSDAPCGVDGGGRHGYIAAQWGDHHFAGGDRTDASPGL